MQVNKINSLNYSSRVSFGESEGGCYKLDSYPPRNSYELRKKQINDKFNLAREQCCDHNSSSPETFWNQLRKIEAMRKQALEELDATCRKCTSGKWNLLRLFHLK